MAKGTWKQLPPDDPIFTGRLTISSGGSPQESTKSMKTSASDAAGQSTAKSTLPTETAAPPEGEP